MAKTKPKKLTVKNLLMNWKYSNIIECDDEKFYNGEWIRTAVLEYEGKFYYVCIMNGVVKKVTPLEKMEYSYYNGQTNPKDIDNQITELLQKIKDTLPQ